MNQATLVVGAVLVAFVAYVATKGRLGVYYSVVVGGGGGSAGASSTSSAAPSLNPASPSFNPLGFGQSLGQAFRNLF